MRGITEGRLKEIKEKMPDGKSKLFVHALITQCTELNAWQPIETAPLGKKLWLLMNGSIGIGATEWTLYNDSDRQHFTHWQELPEDPK